MRKDLILVYSVIGKDIFYRGISCENGSVLWAGCMPNTEGYEVAICGLKSDIEGFGFNVLSIINNN